MLDIKESSKELFLECTNLLDKDIRKAVKNLLIFGYSNANTIKYRVSCFFRFHVSLEPEFGIQNFSYYTEEIDEKIRKLKREVDLFLYLEGDRLSLIHI